MFREGGNPAEVLHCEHLCVGDAGREEAAAAGCKQTLLRGGAAAERT